MCKRVKRGAVLLRTQEELRTKLDLVLVSIDSCFKIRNSSKCLASGDKFFRFNFFNQPLQAVTHIYSGYVVHQFTFMYYVSLKPRVFNTRS